MEQTGTAKYEDNEFEPAPAVRFSFVGEIWAFLRERKLYWLAPIIFSLVLLGALFLLASHAGVVSPIFYML